MITGVHALIFNPQAEAVRTFFRDVLEWPAVDAGGGWHIFQMPPAELGIHPVDQDTPPSHELYLMCDDIEATQADLEARGVTFTRPISDERFGRVAWLRIPGGAELALYQPRHPTAIASASASA